VLLVLLSCRNSRTYLRILFLCSSNYAFER
jgi:hypothetical protein